MYTYNAEVVKCEKDPKGGFKAFLDLDLGFQTWKVQQVYIDKEVTPGSNIKVRIHQKTAIKYKPLRKKYVYTATEIV